LFSSGHSTQMKYFEEQHLWETQSSSKSFLRCECSLEEEFFSSMNMHQKYTCIVRPKNFSETALLQNCKGQKATKRCFFSALWQP